MLKQPKIVAQIVIFIANFGLILLFYGSGVKKLKSSNSIFCPRWVETEFPETRQDETMRQEKTKIQDKFETERCISRQDKTLKFFKNCIQDKTRLLIFSKCRDETGRDSISRLVPAGKSGREISRPITEMTFMFETFIACITFKYLLFFMIIFMTLQGIWSSKTFFTKVAFK